MCAYCCVCVFLCELCLCVYVRAAACAYSYVSCVCMCPYCCVCVFLCEFRVYVSVLLPVRVLM